MNPLTKDRERLERAQYGALFPNDHIIYKKRGGGEKLIPSNKWRINRNTPVGEPADLYEERPYGGLKLLEWNNVIGVYRREEDRRK